jgi:Uma2 family endonuclease
MPASPSHSRYTLDEFVRLEEYSNVKHEYLDGQIFAMAGGTPEHGAIAMRVGAALLAQLRGKRCNVYSSDVRVRVAATGLDTYPDLSVVCGQEQRDDRDPNALTNPIVIVEVLSPSTEDYDRGEKLEHYKQIPSIREILLVSHHEHRLALWRREGSAWTLKEAAGTDVLRLDSIDCELEVEEIYRDPLH